MYCLSIFHAVPIPHLAHHVSGRLRVLNARGEEERLLGDKVRAAATVQLAGQRERQLRAQTLTNANESVCRDLCARKVNGSLNSRLSDAEHVLQPISE